MKAHHVALIFGTGILWGSSFLFIKVAVQETSPMVVVENRLIFSTATLAAVLLLQRTWLRLSRDLAASLGLLAFINAIIPYLAISWGQERIDAGAASVLLATVPLFAALLSALFLADEHLNPVKTLGLLTGFAGIVVFTGGDIFSIKESSTLGQLAVLGAAFSWGANTVYSRTLLRKYDPLPLTCLNFATAGLFFIPFLLLIDAPPDYSFSVKVWLMLIGLGALGSGFGMVLYMWLIKQVGAVNASMANYLTPISGLFLGWAILDESISANSLLGCAVVIAGVALVVRGRITPLAWPRVSPQRLPRPAAATSAERRD